MASLSVMAAVCLLPAYLIKIRIGPWPSNLWEIVVLAAFLMNVLLRPDFWSEIRRRWPARTALWILVLLSGLGLSAAAGGFTPASLGIIKGWFLVPIMLGLLVSVEEKDRILSAVFLSGSAISLLALSDWFRADLTYDGRLNSIYLSPNHLAMYLAPAIFLGGYLLKRYRNLSVRLLVASGLAAIAAALYLTYSYAAWAAVLAGWMIAETLFSGHPLSRKLLLSVFVSVLLFLSQSENTKMQHILDGFSPSSWDSRQAIWQAAWKIGSDHPLLGIGPGNFQESYLAYQKYFPPYPEWAVPQPHNLYLAFWLESGILGLAAFLILVGGWFLETDRRKKTGRDGLILALSGTMLYVLIHGLVDTPYWKNDLAGLFWIVFALGLGSGSTAISASEDTASRPGG